MLKFVYNVSCKSYMIFGQEDLDDVIVSGVCGDVQRRKVLHLRHVVAAREAALARVQRPPAVAVASA